MGTTRFHHVNASVKHGVGPKNLDAAAARMVVEIVMAIVNTASHPVDDDIVKLGESVDLEADLRDLARRQLALVLQPRPPCSSARTDHPTPVRSTIGPTTP